MNTSTTMTTQALRLVVQAIVDQIGYRGDDYKLQVTSTQDGSVYLQLLHHRPDTYTGEMTWGGTALRPIPPTSTVSEVVRAAFALILSYEEHEAREAFTFRGVRVFGPHIDINALVEVGERLDVHP